MRCRAPAGCDAQAWTVNARSGSGTQNLHSSEQMAARCQKLLALCAATDASSLHWTRDDVRFHGCVVAGLASRWAASSAARAWYWAALALNCSPSWRCIQSAAARYAAAAFGSPALSSSTACFASSAASAAVVGARTASWTDAEYQAAMYDRSAECLPSCR
eukprot:COSAG04_NODE_281_length_18193_cov_4.163701_2_plen_161_part_00